MNSEKKVHQVWTQLSIKRNDNLGAKKKRQFFLKYHKNLNIFPFLGAFIQGRIQISPKNYNLSVLPFWANFCALTLLTRKIKILKKNEKNAWRYYHFIHVYHEWKSWCMVPEIWSRQTEFLLILSHFLHFYPTSNPKWKKTHGYIIILHKCTKRYGIWFFILGYFFPFKPTLSLPEKTPK